MDDFFTLARIFWTLAVPSNVLVFLAVLGLALLATGTRKLGFAVVFLAVVGQAVAGFSPLSAYLISPLEERFPPFVPDGRPVDGIILLGGAENSDMTVVRNAPNVNDAAERIIAFAALARQYPEAQLVFTGTAGPYGDNDPRATAAMRLILQSLGMDVSRVRFEAQARNTAENALFTRRMMEPAAGSRWLLVTSAFHMPRAMGCFRAVDFPVTAYPVDYRTMGPGHLDALFTRAAAGQDLTDISSKEWVGLLVYYLTGRTNALFPAP